MKINYHYHCLKVTYWVLPTRWMAPKFGVISCIQGSINPWKQAISMLPLEHASIISGVVIFDGYAEIYGTEVCIQAIKHVYPIIKRKHLINLRGLFSSFISNKSEISFMPRAVQILWMVFVRRQKYIMWWRHVSIFYVNV